MTKAEIINEVAQQTGLTQIEVEATLVEILNSISSALQRGERVDLRGFGNFTVQHRPARMGHNPATMERVRVAERYRPVFKASPRLQDQVNKARIRGF